MDDTSQYPMLIISFEQQKEAIGNEQRKEKVEEPKYSEREQQGKDGKTYNLEVLVQKQKKKEIYKFRTGSRGELRISNRDVCPLCNRRVKTGAQCGICSRWFHYKCEGTTEERVLKEYPHETHYICKKDKEQKQLKVAMRDLRNQLQEEEEEEEKGTKVEAKYKNLQKIHECTKK